MGATQKVMRVLGATLPNSGQNSGRFRPHLRLHCDPHTTWTMLSKVSGVRPNLTQQPLANVDQPWRGRPNLESVLDKTPCDSNDDPCCEFPRLWTKRPSRDDVGEPERVEISRKVAQLAVCCPPGENIGFVQSARARFRPPYIESGPSAGDWSGDNSNRCCLWSDVPSHASGQRRQVCAAGQKLLRLRNTCVRASAEFAPGLSFFRGRLQPD